MSPKDVTHFQHHRPAVRDFYFNRIFLAVFLLVVVAFAENGKQQFFKIRRTCHQQHGMGIDRPYCVVAGGAVV